MIDKFTNYLVSLRGYSENTARGYEKDIRHFQNWLKENVDGARWSLVTRDHIDKYISDEVARGLKPATTNRRLSSIAALYNWFKREGYDIENPCKFESRRKNPPQAPNTIPTGQLNEAYAHAVGATKFLLGLLMTTGMRIQEVLDMNWEDINFETQAIKVHGKGGKSRIVFSTPDVLEPARAAHEYMHKTGRMWGIDQRTARHMVWEALKPFCNAPQLSPHAIRHTFATNIASHGGNVSTLGQILGHKHLETTQRYIDLAQAPVRQTCQQYTLFN